MYKGTKIIHTLYPDDNKLKKKKIKSFNYARGEVTIDELPHHNARLIQIPYYNYHLKYKYLITIAKHIRTNKESIYIHALGEKGEEVHKYYVGEMPLSHYPYPDKEAKYYQFMDLSGLESIIKQYHKQLVKDGIVKDD